jgi:hypothetical protein
MKVTLTRQDPGEAAKCADESRQQNVQCPRGKALPSLELPLVAGKDRDKAHGESLSSGCSIPAAATGDAETCCSTCSVHPWTVAKFNASPRSQELAVTSSCHFCRTLLFPASSVLHQLPTLAIILPLFCLLLVSFAEPWITVGLYFLLFFLPSLLSAFFPYWDSSPRS